MGKIVKSVLKVAAVAVVAFGGPLGLSVLAATALSAGLSIGASLIKTKPKSPAASPEAFQRLRANIDPRTPRKTAVGITALEIDVR